MSIVSSVSDIMVLCMFVCFFFQAEDGIRDLVRSRGLGDVYKRQAKGLYVFVNYTSNETQALETVAAKLQVVMPVQLLSLIHI